MPAIEFANAGDFGPFGPAGVSLQGVANELGLAAALRFGHSAKRQHRIRVEVDGGLDQHAI